jgi:hypothetical protein
MGLNVKKVAMNGGGKKIAPQEAVDAGTYPNRLVQLIDLGLQPQKAWDGNEKPPKQEVMLTYELLDEFCVDENGEELEDKPRWIGETITLNNLDVDLATSTKRYKALDPNLEHDGDFTQLMGTPSMVTITATPGKGKNAGRTFNNVANVAPMRAKEAAKAAPLVNDPKVFIVSEPDLDVFRSLPEWIQDKIKSNLEYNGSELQRLLDGKVEQKKEPEPQPEPEVNDESEPEVNDDPEDQQPW